MQRPWTIEQFLSWAITQDGRYEFVGVQPVAMTGGNARYSRVTTNVHAALRSRMRGTRCSFFFGADLGLQTIRFRIRTPDALITCTKFPETEQLAPDVLVVFKVLSPSSSQTDRIDRDRE